MQQDIGVLARCRDIHLLRRYDVRNLCLITASYRAPDGKQRPFVLRLWALRSVAGRYYMTTYNSSAAISLETLLISPVEYNENRLDFAWNAGPRPQYQYKLQIRDSLPSKMENPPLEALFNGQVYHHLLDEKSQADQDPLVAFAARVVQTYRSGNKGQWLNLWLPAEVQQRWNEVQTGTPPLYLSERKRFNDKPLFVSFVIDFGPNAVIFLSGKAKNPSQFDFIVAWKTSAGYKLTQGVFLPDGNSTFRNNLSFLFNSTEFQAYLKTIIGTTGNRGAAKF